VFPEVLRNQDFGFSGKLTICVRSSRWRLSPPTIYYYFSGLSNSWVVDSGFAILFLEQNLNLLRMSVLSAKKEDS